jgi:pyridoxamine 5'-phosphate oxidase
VSLPPDDPHTLFEAWFGDAERCPEIRYAHAMCLATVDPDGLPEARTVLLKHLDADGFVFFTDSRSPKAVSLERLPEAALVFYWEPLERQVRIRGGVETASDEISDACFRKRPRASQVTAWASLQSRPLAGPEELAERVAEIESRFEGARTLPRPPYWQAYRLRARSFEFWQAGAGRRHERVLYRLTEGGAWETSRLYP